MENLPGDQLSFVLWRLPIGLLPQKRKKEKMYSMGHNK
jgi:hypothetical protein